MSNGFNNRIGVTIEEGIANATSISSGVNTRNIGMLTERVRGLVGKPVLITSLKEDRKKFGEHDPNMYSSFVIESLFNNAGGYPVSLYQSRVVGEGSLPATVAMKGNFVEEVGEDILKFFAGQGGVKDVGTWGNSLKVRVYPMGNQSGSNDGIVVQVFYKGYFVETFTSNGENLTDLRDQINSRSAYVMVELIDPAGTFEDVTDLTLSGGVYVSPVEADFTPSYNEVTEEPKGMAVFDNADVQILACPEVFTVNFAKACDDYARTNLKFFIFNMPYLATEATLESYFNALSTPDQSFTAGYLEWIEVPLDTTGNRGWIPQLGYILGAGYIRKAGLFNGAVWTPPAGVETSARGVYAFTHTDLNNDRRSRFVKVLRCNVTQYVNNVGYCSWSSRTYSNNALFESIHVRLETNWLVRNLEINSAKWMQRILSPTLAKTIHYDNEIWFKNLYEKGGVEQSIPFKDAVIIEVSFSKENRKEGEMEISWIPPECLEHMHIKVNRNDGVLVTNF